MVHFVLFCGLIYFCRRRLCPLLSFPKFLGAIGFVEHFSWLWRRSVRCHSWNISKSFGSGSSNVSSLLLRARSSASFTRHRSLNSLEDRRRHQESVSLRLMRRRCSRCTSKLRLQPESAWLRR